jgi:hypothetical protein
MHKYHLTVNLRFFPVLAMGFLGLADAYVLGELRGFMRRQGKSHTLVNRLAMTFVLGFMLN